MTRQRVKPRNYEGYDRGADTRERGTLTGIFSDDRIFNRELDPLVVSCELNERPATVHGKLVWPEKAMLEAVAAL